MKSLAAGALEAMWIRNIFSEIGLLLSRPITMYVDNQSSIKMAENPVLYKRTKHIEKGCHLVRDHIKKGRVALEFIRSHEQVADIRTKPLPKGEFVTSWIGRHIAKGCCRLVSLRDRPQIILFTEQLTRSARLRLSFKDGSPEFLLIQSNFVKAQISTLCNFITSLGLRGSVGLSTYSPRRCTGPCCRPIMLVS
jgi:hypothetical protein